MLQTFRIPMIRKLLEHLGVLELQWLASEEGALCRRLTWGKKSVKCILAELMAEWDGVEWHL